MSRTSLCGADIPVRETLEAETTNVSANAIRPAIVRAGEILVATLREIFDESAYQRFLERSCLESSTSAYALFQQENAQSKSRRPRCC